MSLYNGIASKLISDCSLCGFPPFYAEDDDEAFDQVIEGKFEYPSPYWDGVTSTSISLEPLAQIVIARGGKGSHKSLAGCGFVQEI